MLSYNTRLKIASLLQPVKIVSTRATDMSLSWLFPDVNGMKHLKAGIRETAHVMFEKVEFRVLKYLRLTECIFGSAPDGA